MNFFNKRTLFLICLLALPIVALADETFLELGGNLFGVATTVRGFFQALCIISGVGLIMGGFVKYTKYRKNPIANPLSMVFVLIIFGLLLIGLSFIPMQV